MAVCPDCDAEIEMDEYDVDKGEIISCPECGVELEVVGLSPLQLDLAVRVTLQREDLALGPLDLNQPLGRIAPVRIRRRLAARRVGLTLAQRVARPLALAGRRPLALGLQVAFMVGARRLDGLSRRAGLGQ